MNGVYFSSVGVKLVGGIGLAVGVDTVGAEFFGQGVRGGEAAQDGVVQTCVVVVIVDARMADPPVTDVQTLGLLACLVGRYIAGQYERRPRRMYPQWCCIHGMKGVR